MRKTTNHYGPTLAIIVIALLTIAVMIEVLSYSKFMERCGRSGRPHTACVTAFALDAEGK